MNHKPFLAGHWLVSGTEKIEEPTPASRLADSIKSKALKSKSKFPTFNNGPKTLMKSPADTACTDFSPEKFLTQGWRGDSLPSKISGGYLRLEQRIQLDVLKLLKTQQFNRSLKMRIYSEFLAYAKDRGMHCPELDDLTSFWTLTHLEASEQPAALSKFLDIFASRVAVITLFKMRFISVLAKQTGLTATSKEARNPNHWLSQIFQVGTKRELKSQVLESNVFSWYRPGEEFTAALDDWMENAGKISITELVKITSPRVQDDQTGKVYSHALSHLNFGLFLNSLLINLPLWAESREPEIHNKFHTPDELEIISCKYSGDYMESLALSHWLAQYNNKHLKWDQVLCPDFKGKEFESGLFMKMLNELQFMTFLAEISDSQNQEPVNFISKIMSCHFQNRKSATPQRGLLGLETPFSTSTYDRTVLNLTHLPKNNPYHWMMGQLDEQLETLKTGGWLFVLASKSLFAPSQRERLQGVLQNLELKAVFEMDGVKGKGELGSWLYAFRRRSKAPSLDQKESVSYFRFTADMESFHEFSDITELLRGFYLSHLEDTPAMWQQEWGRGFRLEFFQDAILDGHLIHSMNEDQSRVTHPKFFKALISSCIPLDTVFELRHLDPEEWQASNAMGIGLRREGATFLMVDLRQQGDTRLSIHPVSTLRSIYYENGSSLCQYFLIAPKHNGMDPNVLRKYFESAVGRQIVNLTFNGSTTKVKGQLSKMLVPKWFSRGEFLPESLKSTLEMFRWNAEKLIATHPQELQERLNMFCQTGNGLFPRYACDVLSSLVEFEQTLEQLTTQLSDSRLSSKVNFENPSLQESLGALKAYPLLQPAHPDVYVEFIQSLEAIDLNSPVTKIELRAQVEGDLKTWFLEIFNDKKAVLRLHSEEELLLFGQFILQMCHGRPLGMVLKAIRLPALSEVKNLVQQARAQHKIFGTLLSETSKFLEESFRQQLILEQ
ncbi:MAG: hypothetical protein K2P81_12145 [Bacteriovoracaceae bacterium]|nr:hypothetical protein [Bacteriovoracaceae bacterium]